MEERPFLEPKPQIVSIQSSTSMLDARFSCNICFDAVTEPVVTQCGHLYCWPCLYRWLEPGMFPQDRIRLGLAPSSVVLVTGVQPPDLSRRVCPVCKAGCSVDSIVPIYVRAADTPTAAAAAAKTASSSSSFAAPPSTTATAPTTVPPKSVSELATSESLSDVGPSNNNDTNITTITNINSTTTIQQQNQQNQRSTLEDDVGECDEDSISSPTSSLEAVLGSATLPNNNDDDLNGQPQFATGLRQRRFATVDSCSSVSSDVPRRPAPQSPMNSPTIQPPSTPDVLGRTRGGIQVTTTNTTTATTTATSATRPTINNNNNNNVTTASTSLSPMTSSSYGGGRQSSSLMLIPFTSGSEAIRRSSVPIIHRPEGFNNPDQQQASEQQQQLFMESDPGATEFLSRILLMLGSFVILCLLLF